MALWTDYEWIVVVGALLAFAMVSRLSLGHAGPPPKDSSFLWGGDQGQQRALISASLMGA